MDLVYIMWNKLVQEKCNDSYCFRSKSLYFFLKIWRDMLFFISKGILFHFFTAAYSVFCAKPAVHVIDVF